MSQDRMPYRATKAARTDEEAEAAARAKAEASAAFSSLLKLDDFHAFVVDMLRECGPLRLPGAGPTNEVFYALGRVNLGNWILRRIAAVDPAMASSLLVQSITKPTPITEDHGDE